MPLMSHFALLCLTLPVSLRWVPDTVSRYERSSRARPVCHRASPPDLGSVNDNQGSLVCPKLEFRQWFFWESCARFANQPVLTWSLFCLIADQVPARLRGAPRSC